MLLCDTFKYDTTKHSCSPVSWTRRGYPEKPCLSLNCFLIKCRNAFKPHKARRDNKKARFLRNSMPRHSQLLSIKSENESKALYTDSSVLSKLNIESCCIVGLVVLRTLFWHFSSFKRHTHISKYTKK